MFSGNSSVWGCLPTLREELRQQRGEMAVIWFHTDPRLVWVRRDLKNHPVPISSHGQGHLPLSQVAQTSGFD